jgi:hypothetical protein
MITSKFIKGGAYEKDIWIDNTLLKLDALHMG